MSVRCEFCHLPLVPSEFAEGVVMHKVETTGEVRIALDCPNFGAPRRKYFQHEPDVSPMYCTTGHLNALWTRSK